MHPELKQSENDAKFVVDKFISFAEQYVGIHLTSSYYQQGFGVEDDYNFVVAITLPDGRYVGANHQAIADKIEELVEELIALNGGGGELISIYQKMIAFADGLKFEWEKLEDKEEMTNA